MPRALEEETSDAVDVWDEDGEADGAEDGADDEATAEEMYDSSIDDGAAENVAAEEVRWTDEVVGVEVAASVEVGMAEDETTAEEGEEASDEDVATSFEEEEGHTELPFSSVVGEQ